MIVPMEAVPFPPIGSEIPKPVSLKDVVISQELLSRRLRRVDGRVELEAMYELASLLGAGRCRC